jgi:hypothetical protein
MYHLRTGTDPINVSFSEQRAIPPPCVMQTAMSGMHWKLTGARLAQANLSLPPKTSHYILTDGGVADRQGLDGHQGGSCDQGIVEGGHTEGRSYFCSGSAE